MDPRAKRSIPDVASPKEMEELFGEWDDALRLDEERLEKELFGIVLKELQENEAYSDDGPPPLPVTQTSAVVEVSMSWRSYEWKGTLVAFANDGKPYEYTVKVYHYSGSMYEPPDDLFEIDWKEVPIAPSK